MAEEGRKKKHACMRVVIWIIIFQPNKQQLNNKQINHFHKIYQLIKQEIGENILVDMHAHAVREKWEVETEIQLRRRSCIFSNYYTHPPNLLSRIVSCV
jgi:calcineurin-like phosphoesterase